MTLKTNLEIQNESNLIHNYTYKFKGRVENNNRFGIFHCRIHNNTYEQYITDNVIAGKHCCVKCAQNKKKKSRNISNNEIQKLSNDVFGYFSFKGRDLINNELGYFSCTKHNRTYLQKIFNHKMGFNPCNKCNIRTNNSKLINKNAFLITKQKFQEKSTSIFGNYLFIDIITGTTYHDIRCSFFCSKHKTYTVQLIKGHLSGKHCCMQCNIENKKIHKKFSDKIIQMKSNEKFGHFHFEHRNKEKTGFGFFTCKKHNFTKSQKITEHFKGINPCIKCNGRDIPLNELKLKFKAKFGNRIKLIKKLKYSKVELKCNIHKNQGTYIRTFNAVLKTKNGGCLKCADRTAKRLSIEQYQQRMENNSESKNKFVIERLIHNGIGKGTQAVIRCVKHPEEEIVRSALSIGRSVPKCPKCITQRICQRLSHEQIMMNINLNLNLHYSNYDFINYERLNNRWIVNLLCRNHHKLTRTVLSNLKKGTTSCQQCVSMKHNSKNKFSYSDFVNLGVKHHNNEYEYPKIPFKSHPFENTNSKLYVFCKKPDHGYFETTFKEHITNKSGNCPLCKNSSSYEKKIMNYLRKNNIEFQFHFKFKDCKHIQILEFDFYIKKYNLLIEFDGHQHYTYPNVYHKTVEDFENQKIRDKKKNKYARENKINILRIREDNKLNFKFEIDNAIAIINKNSYFYKIN